MTQFGPCRCKESASGDAGCGCIFAAVAFFVVAAGMIARKLDVGWAGALAPIWVPVLLMAVLRLLMSDTTRRDE